MKYLLFLGSTRASAPPRPTRLGERLARAMMPILNEDSRETELIDPLEIDLPHPFKPHFAYAKDKAPDTLGALAEQISAADGYVMLSPEYNHSLSPALAHLLNHFGASRFGFKPSVIATYSAGQWGGVRAAVTMRGFLSELGCLPVSAMIHVPKVAEVLDDNGVYLEDVDGEKWRGYFNRAFQQLDWWAEAAKHQRDSGATKETKPFTRDPSPRNAP